MVDIGWSESYQALCNDTNRLLVGGNGDIRIVIIIKWNRQPENVSVSGSLELYRIDSQGFPRLDQTIIIFPVPSSTENVRITRRELFGKSILSGRDPNDVLALDVDRLREISRDSLAILGLVPA